MTLLTVAQRVADEVGLPRPVVVATGTDQLGRQMFALANTTLEELGRMNWPQLDETLSFPTVVDQVAYPMPEDYSRFAADTAFVTSMYYQARGALSANEWARRRGSMNANTGYLRFRVMGYPQQIVFVPAPQTVENITIEYLSSYLVKGNDNTRKPLYTLDDDVSVVPEELVRRGLKWRIKHAKGLDYSEDFNSYEAVKSEMFAQALSLGSIPVAQRWPFGDNAPELGYPYIPDTGYGG